jgi:hypothetical protein
MLIANEHFISTFTTSKPRIIHELTIDLGD